LTVQEYLKNIEKRYKEGHAREHAYRGDLQTLIESICPGIIATNDPKRQECGAPDYIITRKKIPVGYIEAKDIGINLNDTENSEQMNRYKLSLDNLILTDYINFYYFKNGKKVSTICLGTIEKNKIVINDKNVTAFETFIKDFCSSKNQIITSAESLARMMANKAKLMQSVIFNTVSRDTEKNTLKEQLEAFKKILIHDLTEQEFADIYSQTIAYGLFAARLHDKTPETFSREEALFLVPETNPFLRKLFTYVAGPDLDDRIVWIVDDLAEILLACDIKEILKDFGSMTHQKDPMIHFYETFLAEYNPALRKSRGVYYTPEPVVNFIIKSVDYILENDFKLSGGLSNTDKVSIAVKGVQGKGLKSKETKEIHKVQILDPATGTGTFLSEAIKNIYARFKTQKGVWSSYIENHLIPRLHGFELLMAPYTICHLKLELLLDELGYKPKKNERFKVYLTNSLEEAHPDTGTLFASWLSEEANEANHVKKDTPIMVVFGNPPYSGHSANKGEWIEKLLEDYKQEPTGGKLKEQTSKWLSDDYVKFLRYGQYFIEKNNEGILAFINNNGFLDNPTFRGMRWNLLKTFDKIYILDLHGSSKKQEVSPDGSSDENVFDIQQGVSINIFIKTGIKKANDLADVFYSNLFGKRETKYDFLWKNRIDTTKYKKIKLVAPHYFFIDKDYGDKDKYNSGFSLEELFTIKGAGITTAHDTFVIDDDKNKLLKKFISFKNSEANFKLLHNKFSVQEKKGWNILNGWKNLQNDKDINKYIHKIAYRPFDIKYIFYENKLVWRTVDKVMQHMVSDDSLGIMTNKKIEIGDFRHCIVYKNIAEAHAISLKEVNYMFPLYKYDTSNQLFENKARRVPNFEEKILKQLSNVLEMNFVHEKAIKNNTFAPVDILDYIYSVLYCSSYRRKYNELLKIDFPRIPYPTDKSSFLKLVEKGSELRRLHLMDDKAIGKLKTSYSVEGNNKVEKIKFEKERVYINKDQYFDKVPELAWEFYIGGYQPAQKWLKDRKDRVLSYEDIIHYQKIIYVLTETDRIMKEIDKIVEF
jgi:predicted helicase